MQSIAAAPPFESNAHTHRSLYRIVAYVLLLPPPIVVGASVGAFGLMFVLDRTNGLGLIRTSPTMGFVFTLYWMWLTLIGLIVGCFLSVFGIALSVWKRKMIRDKGTIVLSILDTLIITGSACTVFLLIAVVIA